jgi:hypothetical protein
VIVSDVAFAQVAERDVSDEDLSDVAAG